VRATPCIGICSTTYGDLVCRGCKRFAHEIVAWNGYTSAQRDIVWNRLHALIEQSTEVFISIEDADALRSIASTLRLGDDRSPMATAYEVLRRRARDVARLEQIGMRPMRADVAESPVAVRDAIEKEFYVRSVAYFERSFHVTVDS
jgi:predicted Fe-S protein YdhL (DUF1289 family)